MINLFSATVSQFLNLDFFNNQMKNYLAALVVFLITLFVFRLVRIVIVSKIRKIAKKSKTEIDDVAVAVIDSFGWLFYVVLALALALKFLTLPEIVGQIVHYAVLITVALYIIKALQALIDFGLQRIINKREKEGEFDPSIVKLLGKIAKGILWLGVALVVLQNIGVDITTLIAGLGVGGIAIAFALQHVLADVFASFSIYFDKPFKVGDFIIVGGDMGVVKKIGIKSTRIQHLGGQELVFSNKELTDARINNYKKMERRRIVFNFGIKYETPSEKVKKIPQIVKDIISNLDSCQLDRVHFKEFGDFSLNFEVVYYLESPDYNLYMDRQEEINLKLKEQFEKEEIEFAYPTQTVLLNKN